MKNKSLFLFVFIFSGIFICNASCPGDTARFSSNAPKCISDSVKFTDASTILFGDAIVSWKWNFGNPGSGINNTSTLQHPSHLYTAGNTTFVVKLVITYAFGCKDSLTINIGIQSLVVANAGTNITSCKNNVSVNLVGSILNAGGGSWIASGTFSNLNSLTPIYTPTAAAKASGTDTVVLTSFSPAFCQNDRDTVVIFFYPGPTVNAGPNFSVCKDTSSIPVSAIITVATGGTWQTTGGGTFANGSQTSTLYFPSTSDTAAGSVLIFMESTGNGICLAARDSVTITFTPTPTVLIKTNDSSCARSSIELNVTVSTGSGVWVSSGTGTFSPNNTVLNGFYFPSPADDLLGKVTLKFTSTNNGGCQSAFDTLDVIIKPAPIAAYASVTKCAMVPIQFTDSSSTSAGAILSWNWNFGDGSANGSSANPLHIYTTGGPYSVSLTVTSTNGCKDTATNLVNVYRLPTPAYTVSGLCLNTGTVFTNTSTVAGATITASHWNFGNNTTSSLSNPTHFFPSSAFPGWPVKLVVQSSQGCFDSITQTIPVVAGPVAAYTADDVTAIINQKITFSDLSTSAISLSWNFGDSSPESTQQNPSHIYTVGGVYTVCLVATDASGCKDTACQKEIVSTHPSGPTGFSPNADGQNDVFYVYGGPFKTLTFRIYNNWGELVFESNKQSDGWDGKRNGVDQPIGVYVYVVVGITEDGNEYKLSGDVTLLR